MKTLISRKFLKGRTRKEVVDRIAMDVKRGWKQISDIKEGHTEYQVLMEFIVEREVAE